VKNDQTDSQYLISLACWREKAEKHKKDMEEVERHNRGLNNARKTRNKESLFSKILKFFKLRS